MYITFVFFFCDLINSIYCKRIKIVVPLEAISVPCCRKLRKMSHEQVFESNWNMEHLLREQSVAQADFKHGSMVLFRYGLIPAFLLVAYTPWNMSLLLLAKPEVAK